MAAIPAGYLALGSMAASAALQSSANKRSVQASNAQQSAQNELLTQQYELSRNNLSERIAQLNVDTGKAIADLQQKAGQARGTAAAMVGASGQRGQSVLDMQQELRQQQAQQLDSIQTQSDAQRANLLQEGASNYRSLEQNLDYNYTNYNDVNDFAKVFATKVMGNLGGLTSAFGGTASSQIPGATSGITLSTGDVNRMSSVNNPFSSFTGYQNTNSGYNFGVGSNLTFS